MKNILALFFLFIFLAGCTPSLDLQIQKIQTTCCGECLAQAERDPSGYDISIKPCGQYELSEGCGDFFGKENVLSLRSELASRQVLVGECREITKG